MPMPTPVVSPEWLAAHLSNPSVAILDARFAIGQPDAGRQLYLAGHIPGAVHVDLERDLSGPPQEHGGRHPLPDPAELAAKLGRAGIGNETPVVIYDETGEMAARCWWVLRYLGHTQVAILDGGFIAWERAARPLTTAVVEHPPRTFTPNPQPQMIATMAEVRDRSAGTVIIDSRARSRYIGQPHPLDSKSGHIPGAINRFWKDALHPDHTWKTAAEQPELDRLRTAESIIVHCGSGVTACPNILALEQAGIQGVRLYVGSWSDWTSYPESPVETGE